MKKSLSPSAEVGNPSAARASGQSFLIAVTGISPAILTETVWGLAGEGVLPSRVIAVTTTSGCDRLEKDLLEPRPEFGNAAVCLRKRYLSHK